MSLIKLINIRTRIYFLWKFTKQSWIFKLVITPFLFCSLLSLSYKEYFHIFLLFFAGFLLQSTAVSGHCLGFSVFLSLRCTVYYVHCTVLDLFVRLEKQRFIRVDPILSEKEKSFSGILVTNRKYNNNNSIYVKGILILWNLSLHFNTSHFHHLYLHEKINENQISTFMWFDAYRILLKFYLWSMGADFFPQNSGR